jgi:uncharacterized protein with FMN-binding domain
MKHIIFQRLKVVRLKVVRLLTLVFAGVVCSPVLFSSCAGLKTENQTEESRADGVYEVYEGAAPGYRGMIRVRVGYEDGVITEITVIESREDRAVGGEAMEELTDLVLMYNTTEIDAITGATETSKGFLAAIENALP